MKLNPKKTPEKLSPAETLQIAEATFEQHFGPLHYQPTESLKPYGNNPRKHSEKQITQLAASISHFGFAIPILIDRDKVIVAGEGRWRAAQKLGLSKVPTLCASGWSKAQVRAYRLADNRLAEHATWDADALRCEIQGIIEIADVPIELVGWNTAEIDVLLDGSGIEDGADPADDLPEPPATSVSQLGDKWKLGPHRLLCGSSLDPANWAQLMGGKLAVMAFTDAPYNVPVNGHVSGLGKVKHAEFAMASGEMSQAQFQQFNLDYLINLKAWVTAGGLIMACMDWRGINPLLSAGEAAQLKLINLVVWKKTNAGMGSLYRSHHELIAIFKSGSAPHINNVELGKHGRYRTNVWDYAGANSFSATRDADLAAHPTVKPTALVADAIRDVSRHGDTVLDAFMGSGTTILAAERTGRVAYGIEIEPKYVDVAMQRWSAMTGGIPVLESTGETLDEVRQRRAAERAQPIQSLAA